MEHPKVRLLVVDDHPMVRAGLVEILQADPRLEVVAQAGSGAEALVQFIAARPDVVLMDLRLPDTSGVEAIERIRAQKPSATIVIVTAVEDEEDIYRGLRAGAKGYLLKDAPPAEIVEAMATIVDGRRYLAPSLAAKLADHLDSEQLSSRETEILQLMATGQTNKGIARQAGITEGTVKFHVNNILSKLECASRTEAVALALKRGLIKLA